MTRALALAVLLASGTASAEGSNAWSTISDDTTASAEQIEQGRGCRLTVKRNEEVVWSVARCVAEKQDARFVSNDGRLLVLFAFPDGKAGIKAARAGELWRAGKVVASWPVGRFVKDVKPLVATSRHFYWLEGAMGQPGVPPGVPAKTQVVELVTLDRRSWRIGFDGSIKAIPPPDPLKAMKKAQP